MQLSLIRERILDTPLAKKLPEPMRQRFVKILLWIAKTEEVSREQELFKQGETDTDRGCLILEGMVRIITEKSGSKTIDAPDILGEVQLFTPKGERTATVEVVVGGEILTFGWRDFASQAREQFNNEEMATMRNLIAESAWAREDKLLERVQAKAKN